MENENKELKDFKTKTTSKAKIIAATHRAFRHGKIWHDNGNVKNIYVEYDGQLLSLRLISISK